jgi:hypothetical protein
VSFTFGPDVVSRFLQKHDMDLICRAHQVVEDGYEFFSKRQLVTLFSAPNYCGEFDNAGAMMSVDESLLCSFQVRSVRRRSRLTRANRVYRFSSLQRRNKSTSPALAAADQRLLAPRKAPSSHDHTHSESIRTSFAAGLGVVRRWQSLALPRVPMPNDANTPHLDFVTPHPFRLWLCRRPLAFVHNPVVDSWHTSTVRRTRRQRARRRALSFPDDSTTAMALAFCKVEGETRGRISEHWLRGRHRQQHLRKRQKIKGERRGGQHGGIHCWPLGLVGL